MTDASPHATRPRWDAFDHLRGLAAVAVVVLHGAYAYSLRPLDGLLWPVPIDEPARMVDALFWAIEGCVMPIFFLMSGFFLAHSLLRKSPGEVLVGRSRRLMYPMAAIGIPVLTVDLFIWGFGLVQMGRVSPHRYLTVHYPREIRAELFGPAHLWYVEYLWLMCVGLCVIWWLAGRAKSAWASRTPARDESGDSANSGGDAISYFLLAALAVSIVAVLTIEPAIVVGFQHGWLPAVPKFFHGLMFLLAGMVLARSISLQDALRRLAPLLFVGAALVFGLMLPRVHALMQSGEGARFNLEMGIILGVYALLAAGGVVGGCLKWLNRPMRHLAFLGAASFWVYIVHHPILGLAHLGLRPLPLPAIAKFLIATGGTLSVCLLSYRYLVAGGTVGELLAGRWPWAASKCDPMRQPSSREPTSSITDRPAPRRAA